MSIRTHWPLPIRAGLICTGLLVYGWLVWIWAQPGHDAAVIPKGLPQLTTRLPELQARIAQLEQNNAELSEMAGRNEELLKLEKAGQQQLAQTVRNLEAENARIKEDLAFFEGFIPGDTPAGLSIRRPQFTQDTVPGQWNYRALVTQGAESKEQKYAYQLIIKTSGGDKQDMIIFPDPANKSNPSAGGKITAVDSPGFVVSIKRFARLQGAVRLPEGTVPQSVEFRILDKTNIRAQTVLRLQ